MLAEYIGISFHEHIQEYMGNSARTQNFFVVKYDGSAEFIFLLRQTVAKNKYGGVKGLNVEGCY